MPYAGTADLAARYQERELRHLTDPNAQAVDDTRALRALGDATEEIDGYLAQRFVLPLASAATGAALGSAPVLLVRLCCDIAIYRMQTLRPADEIKDARQRYDDAIKLLKSMAKGEATLAGVKLRADVAPAAPAQSPGMPQFGVPPSLFGRDAR